MLSVHRDRIKSKKASFIESVVDEFGIDPRRLQFLFHQ
jgi:coenzyme F420-reducing hydrogenase delta subunit